MATEEVLAHASEHNRGGWRRSGSHYLAACGQPPCLLECTPVMSRHVAQEPSRHFYGT